MNLIGHCEFGLNTIPFTYNSDDDNWFKIISKKTLDYWLVQWIKTYEWIMKSDLMNRKNILIVPYEKLCKDYSFYENICKKININNHKSGLSFNSANKDSEVESLLERKQLITLSKNIYKKIIENSKF